MTSTARGRCLPEFERVLEPYHRDDLDAHDGTVCAIDRELRLIYVNPGWDRFAEENGGQPGIRTRWDLGVRILDAISPELRPFYASLLSVDRLREASGTAGVPGVPGESGEPGAPEKAGVAGAHGGLGSPGSGNMAIHRSHEYECSSDGVFRRMRMEVFPLPDRAGLLLAHSAVVERPHDDLRRPVAADPTRFVHPDGFLRQCSHCRRIQRPGLRECWDWVPVWVATAPPETSHTLCPLCLGYYYAEVD